MVFIKRQSLLGGAWVDILTMRGFIKTSHNRNFGHMQMNTSDSYLLEPVLKTELNVGSRAVIFFVGK